MAAPRKIATRHYPELRQRIKAVKLINRLQDFALRDLTVEEWVKPPMSETQVRTALGLLKKVLPDLANVEHSTEDGEGFVIKVVA